MDAHDFVTLSLRREIYLDSSRPPEDILGDFLAALSRALREAGCTLVGHIKGMVESEQGLPLFFSLTSLDAAPRYRGGPLRQGIRSILSMNVIVAGISSNDTARLCDDAAAIFFRA